MTGQIGQTLLNCDLRIRDPAHVRGTVRGFDRVTPPNQNLFKIADQLKRL